MRKRQEMWLTNNCGVYNRHGAKTEDFVELSMLYMGIIQYKGPVKKLTSLRLVDWFSDKELRVFMKTWREPSYLKTQLFSTSQLLSWHLKNVLHQISLCILENNFSWLMFQNCYRDHTVALYLPWRGNFFSRDWSSIDHVVANNLPRRGNAPVKFSIYKD